MLFSYGEGEYIESSKRVKGQIILSEHKLYLRGSEGDLTETYIPLEKIINVRKSMRGMEVIVRQSLTLQFKALFQGERKLIADLIKDLVKRRGLTKKIFKSEWEDRSI